MENLQILIAHASIQDNLLQSYRQIFLTLQSLILIIGVIIYESVIGSQSSEQNPMYIFPIFIVILIFAFLVTWIFRQITRSRGECVTFWHRKILMAEQLLQDIETKYFTEFKLEQNPSLKKDIDIKNYYPAFDRVIHTASIKELRICLDILLMSL